jgi:hypothetical protein
MTCQPYTLIETDCPCLIKLQKGNVILCLNLFGAVVYPFTDGTGFSIKTLLGGANVLSAGSNFTIQDIEQKICSCTGQQSGG